MPKKLKKKNVLLIVSLLMVAVGLSGCSTDIPATPTVTVTVTPEPSQEATEMIPATPGPYDPNADSSVTKHDSTPPNPEGANTDADNDFVRKMLEESN